MYQHAIKRHTVWDNAVYINLLIYKKFFAHSPKGPLPDYARTTASEKVLTGLASNGTYLKDIHPYPPRISHKPYPLSFPRKRE